MTRDEQGQSLDRILQIFRGSAWHDIERSAAARRSLRNRSMRWVSGRAGMALSMLLMVMTGSAAAQESSRSWQVSGGGTYNTQREAEQEIQGRGGDWSYVRVIKNQEITEAKVNVTYWMGVAPSQLQEWSYEGLFGSPAVNVSATEEELRSKYILKYNQRSVADGCTANATAERTNEWAAVQFWGDGVSFRERARFSMRYQAKGVFNPTVCSSFTAEENPGRVRARCANPSMTWQDTEQHCENRNLSATITSKPLLCDRCGMVGNPSDVTTGDKYEPEPDIDLSWIELSRHYHSGATNVGGGFGYGWTHSQNVRLMVEPIFVFGAIGLIQADGSQLPFKNVGTNLYEDTIGRGDRLALSGNSWTLHQQQRLMEFNTEGRLTALRNEDGTSLVYAYNNLSQLTTITHNTGRRLEFGYDPGAPIGVSRILSVAVNGVVQMSYAYTPAGLLDAVTYADLRQRKYHYEDLRFPSNLTGITDENNSRYSTFAYDDKGRVLSSVHAGGVEGTQLVYTASGGAQVTDANNLVTDYALTSGADDRPRKVADVTRPTSSVSRTYNDVAIDFRRRLNTYVDRNNVTTKYGYQTLTDAVTQRVVTRYTTQEAFETTSERSSVVDRDLATNRLTLQRVGNRELRIARNARLQPTTVQATDIATALTRTSTIAYCEAADVAAANSTCPIVGLVKELNGPRPEVVDVFKDITRYEYRSADEPTCTTSPATCPYRKGDVWKITNAKDHVVEVLAYDVAGRAKSVKDANGVITDFEYSPRGWLLKTKIRGTDNGTETDDRITKVDYFANGTVERITQPDGVYVTFGYDAAHRLTSIADRDGNTITYLLNNAGEREREETRNAAGNLVRTLSRIYNTLGQLEKVRIPHPDPAIVALVDTDFGYDAEGNLDKVTDALAHQTHNQYDALGRLKRTLQNATAAVAAPDRAETVFEYDALDRLTKVTDPNNLDTNYIYNGFGEQTRLESPDTGFTHYRYDAAGNRTQQTDANSRITDYVYDGLNRITAIEYTDLAGEASNDATYAYDIAQSVCPAGETFLVGRLSRMTDGSGETAYCYNRFGDLTRKVQITQDKTFVLQWEYAANGRLQKLIYPDGLAVEYLYDTQGRPAEINVATSAHRRQLLRSATYHPFGPVQQWTYGNGRLMQRTLNKNYQPGIVEDAAAGGISEGYKFDAIGDLESLQYSSQDAPSRRVYDHDALSRLTLANDAAGVVQQSYAYDKTGNRMQANVRETVVIGDGGGGGPGGPGGGTTTTRLTTSTYAYVPGKHRLWTTGTIERRYDLAGNLIWIGPKSVDEAPDPPPGDPLESAAYSGTEQPTSGIGMEDGGEAPPGLVERAFAYNGMNRMRSVTYGGNLLMSYRYNGRGERVYRTGSNEAVHTVFDESGHWLGDYDANGAVIQQAIWFNDLPVGLAASINGSVRLHYVQPDALGTPRVVIDPQRDVAVWRWDLAGEAFGDGAPDEDPDGDTHRFVLDMRFPGQQYDSATGFNYNYFRDYDPSTGRYSQSDPIGLGGGISTYGYVEGNPFLFSDRLGLIKIPGIDGAVGETSIHANPGPDVTPPGSRAEHNPAHIHLGSNKGPRVLTDTFKPYSAADARKMSAKQMQFCARLSDKAKTLIRLNQASIFKHGKRIASLAMGVGLPGGYASSIAATCRNSPLDCATMIEDGTIMTE